MDRLNLTHSDYRMILKEELDNRCSQNPSYSLRAFARDLTLSPSRLSEILNNKQGLSRKAADRICDHLNMNSDEKNYFLDLVTVAHARSPKDRGIAEIRLLKQKQENDAFYQLKVDTFKIISDWYHLGILELLRIDGFQCDARWIAKRLRITPIQAELAIERLIRVKLLEKIDGKLTATTNTGLIQSEVPSESIRKFHRQILAKAQDALSVQRIEEREFCSQIVSINRNFIPAAKAAIGKFQQRFRSDSDETDDHNELYCLSIQFFSLTERGDS